MVRHLGRLRINALSYHRGITHAGKAGETLVSGIARDGCGVTKPACRAAFSDQLSEDRQSGPLKLIGEQHEQRVHDIPLQPSPASLARGSDPFVAEHVAHGL